MSTCWLGRETHTAKMQFVLRCRCRRCCMRRSGLRHSTNSVSSAMNITSLKTRPCSKYVWVKWSLTSLAYCIIFYQQKCDSLFTDRLLSAKTFPLLLFFHLCSSVINRPSSILFSVCVCMIMPSVLWRCWLGGRKGVRPVKKWVVGYWHGYLSGARCRLACGPADATHSRTKGC